MVMSSVSILQNTIFLRNLTLIVGALIGVFLIYQNRHVLSLRNSFPLISLALLFVWVLIHYLFFAGNPQAQLNELSNVWKRVFLSFLFAVGLGLSINGANRVNLLLVIWGFAASGIVFYVRWMISLLGFNSISPFFTLNYFDTNSLGYVPKYYFSTFIAPFIAIIYCFIAKVLTESFRHRILLIIFSGVGLFACLYVFYFVENKNGILYFLLISLGFFIYFLIRQRHRIMLGAYLALTFFVISLSPLIYTHFKSQPTWGTLLEDSRVALDFRISDEWKYDGTRQTLPLNELNIPVSTTTYLRVAWAIKGSELLLANPLGFGLVINSFGALAKERWPESRLFHSHSGWIDLGLAFGIPGLVLILVALIGAFVKCSKKSSFIPQAGTWALGAIFLVFLTSEVAERISFDYLIFLIAFFSASTIHAD